jgi:hypothetical protein
VLGFYAPLLHWLTNGVSPGSVGYALALLAIGLGIFAAGAAVHRFGRRPPRVDEAATQE